MSRQYWVSPVGPMPVADGAAYNTSIALTDVSPLPAIQLPGHTLEIGSEFELFAEGQFTNTLTPTLLLGFYFGGVAGVALGASTAITTIVGATAWGWQMQYRGTCRAIGIAGSIQGQGNLRMPASLTQMQAAYVIPATAAARTVAVDTTTAKNITVGAQWGTSAAANSLIVTKISLRLVT